MLTASALNSQEAGSARKLVFVIASRERLEINSQQNDVTPGETGNDQWLARLERTQVLVSVASTTNWKIGQVNPAASHLIEDDMKIEKLLSESTPRPWREFGDGSIRKPGGLFAEDGDTTPGALVSQNNDLDDADLDLILALVNSAPELIALVKAAKMLYGDTMDYIRINNLGGENNHSIKAVREALAALNKHEAWRE